MSTVQGGCTRARRRRRSHALPRRKTVRWSSAEVDGLLEGVREHGVGKWAAILRSSPCFNPVRTSVDLKDKWRNLAAHVRALALQTSLPHNGGVNTAGNSNVNVNIPMSNISNVSSPPRRPRSDDVNANINIHGASNGTNVNVNSGISAISGISSSAPGTTLSRPILIPKNENPLETLHPPPNALQHVSSLAPLAPHPITGHAPISGPPPFVTPGRHVYTTRVLAPLPVGLGTQGGMSHLSSHDDTGNNVNVHHHMSLHNSELPLNTYFGGDFSGNNNNGPGNNGSINTSASNGHGRVNVNVSNSAAMPTGTIPVSSADHLRTLPTQMHNVNVPPVSHSGHHINSSGTQHQSHHGVPHGVQHGHHTHHDAVPTAAGSVNDAAPGASLSFDPFPEPGDL